jgi:hypothetical protein
MIIKKKFNQAPLNKIRIENRNYTVSNLESGDLIKVKAEILPIIYHYGIIEKTGNDIFIIHNQPDKINSKGGNVIKEPLENWIKGRDIVSVEKTDLNTKDLKELYNNLKNYKYDFINFNCEHFVNFAKNKNYVSPQILRMTSVLLIGLTVYFLLKNKRI